MRTGLRRLHYFLALAERRNFRRTAEGLGITQPALSRAIAQLERDVGFALFERDNRNVALTEGGRTFLDGCRRALGLIDEAMARGRKISAGAAGHLVIGYTEIAIAGRLAGIVQSFRQAHPDVVVELRAAWSEAQFDLLAAGSIDVGFMTGPVLKPGIACHAVQEDAFLAVLPPGHRLAEAGVVAVADLAEEPFVLGSEDRWAVYRDHLFRLCGAAGFEPRVVQTAPDTQSIIGLVACGMGITIVADNLQTRGDTRILTRPLAGCDARIETCAVWEAGTANPLVRLFAGHVRGIGAGH